MTSKSIRSRELKGAAALTFLALVIGFAFQYVVMVVADEPYPALLLPDFAVSSYDTKGEITTERLKAAAFTPSGSRESVSLAKLLSDVNNSQTVANKTFGDPLRVRRADLRNWLCVRLAELGLHKSSRFEVRWLGQVLSAKSGKILRSHIMRRISIPTRCTI